MLAPMHMAKSCFPLQNNGRAQPLDSAAVHSGSFHHWNISVAVLQIPLSKFSHFQEKLKWHPLRFTKCHLKSTPHTGLLFSFRVSEKGWRYLNSWRVVLTTFPRKSRISKILLCLCTLFTVPMAFKHFQSSWVLCDWPQGSLSLLYTYLLKIRGQTFWELILPKEASAAQIRDLT